MISKSSSTICLRYKVVQVNLRSSELSCHAQIRLNSKPLHPLIALGASLRRAVKNAIIFFTDVWHSSERVTYRQQKRRSRPQLTSTRPLVIVLWWAESIVSPLHWYQNIIAIEWPWLRSCPQLKSPTHVLYHGLATRRQQQKMTFWQLSDKNV